jgi:hypothetical protein
MTRRSLSVVFLAACTILIDASAAMAAGTDPTKVGDNIKGIIQPNAKSFWWIGLTIGMVFLMFTRKINMAGPLFGIMLVAGVIIYNPAGLGEMMSNLANRVL